MIYYLLRIHILEKVGDKMSTINVLFQERVAQLLESNHDRVLYFFKGFGMPQIQYLSGHPNSILKDLPLCKDGSLDILSLHGKWLDMVMSINLAQGPLVGFYEELLALKDFLSRLPTQKIVIVENNMLKPWTPNYMSHAQALQLFDHQQTEHEPTDQLLGILTQFYGDVKILDSEHALLLPISLDDPRIVYCSFWSEAPCSYDSLESEDQIELGSNDDWLYRLRILQGNRSSALLLQKDSQLSSDQLALADGLNQLGIPFGFDLLELYEESFEYDADQFLPLLKRHWGPNASFRPLLFYKDPDRSHETETISQGSIISEIVDQCEQAVSGEPYSNIFITAPTGAGKSILFQLPALYLAEKYNLVTLVVSPLIALMNDQVDQLERERGISIAACINSSMSMEERLDTIDQICTGKKSLLYLAPELLLTTNLQFFLGGRKVGLIVIDEAHTVTSWGRDFRSDYWFLGDFLKQSKRNGLSFPVLCLTATAVYSGEDDVVNDTIRELGLERTIIHLGNVMRSNIEFDICRHDKDRLTDKVETVKMDLTLQRMRSYIAKDEKVLTYFPYRSQVDQIHPMLDRAEQNRIRRYHGQISSAERKLVEKDYKTGEAMGLFCTKAFGMGIDVGDIKHVVHFAPTGTLADYVQEIGRAARNPEILGIAHIDFFPSDLRYVRTLNGLSEMRQFQLREMLKKLCEIYNAKKRRNLLISAETFEYLFKETDVENRTKSGLMLLAKDLANKYTFPVLIVRPKAMLSKNYVHVPKELNKAFVEKYGAYAKLQIGSTSRTEAARNSSYASDVKIYSNGNTYLVDMAKIWEDCYPDRSFGLFKKEFFEKETVIKGQRFRYSPRVKVDIQYKKEFHEICLRVAQILSTIADVFGSYKNAEVKQFTQQNFSDAMREKLGEQILPREKMGLLLDIFTSSVNENAAYSYELNQVRVLMKRKQVGTDESVYFVNNPAYAQLPNYFARFLNPCVPGSDNAFYRFYPLTPNKPLPIMPLLRLLELLDLATYEIRGGEKAEVFIRINDPIKLQRLSSGRYTNDVLRAIQERHRHNHRLLDAFFRTQMTTEDRWKLIEQYFLGNEDYVSNVLNLHD